MKNEKNKPYNNALIFSGGGFRAGYYLGMYEALCELDKKPDVIFASCGGSIMAGFLALCSDPKIAQNLASSEEFYEMLLRVQTQKPINRTLLLSSAIKRYIKNYASKVTVNISKQKHNEKKVGQQVYGIEENTSFLPWSIFTSFKQQSLFSIKEESEESPFWQPESLLKLVEDSDLNTADINNGQSPKIVMVTSRSVAKKEGFLWQQVLSSKEPDTVALLNHAVSNFVAPISQISPFILPNIHCSDDMDLGLAIRTSINDMFYLPPMQDDKKNYLLGGVIDLLPVEIVSLLANNVYVEKKSPYDKYLAEPAIFSAFGFDANSRQQACNDFIDKNTNIFMIDTSDNGKTIAAMIKRKLRLFSGYIDVQHYSYTEFQTVMHQQYQYGYDKTMQAAANINI